MSMERTTLFEAAVVGGAILLSSAPEATPLRAADSLPSEIPATTLVTPLPESYRDFTPSINSAVNSPEFQTSDQDPGFILFNTYDQNDPTAQDRLIADLGVQKTWIITHGVPADVFEQGIMNLPLESQKTNFNVPVNRLTKDFGDAKEGSLLIPYTNTAGESKLAIFADPDGLGEDTKIDMLGLIPNEGSVITEPKGLPALFKRGIDGQYVAVSIFAVPQESETGKELVPTVTGTPVYQAEVATDSLNLRDVQNPTQVVRQIPRNSKIMVISDRKITVPGKNVIFRQVLTQDGIGLAAENLLAISPIMGSAEYNNPVNLYASVISSAETITTNEGIRVQSSDIIAEQILPDVPVRPIVFVQSTEMQNQPDQFRTGKMTVNKVENFLPLNDGKNPKKPNFTLDGVETVLDSNQAIAISVEQSLMRIAKANGLIPKETTFEDFMRNYQDIKIPIFGKDGVTNSFQVNAPIIFRFRGFESSKPQKGLVNTSNGSFERSLGPNGELIVDMYYTNAKNNTQYMKFNIEDTPNSDEWYSNMLFVNAIFSLGDGDSYADFISMFSHYYEGYSNISTAPDLTEIYNPNIQVYPSFPLGAWDLDRSMEVYTNKYTPFSFKR